MELTKRVGEIVETCVGKAMDMKHEYITPEHFLYGLSQSVFFDTLALMNGIQKRDFERDVLLYLDTLDVQISSDGKYHGSGSWQFQEMMRHAQLQAASSGHTNVDIIHIIYGILQLDNSMAHFILCKYFGSDHNFILSQFQDAMDMDDDEEMDEQDREDEARQMQETSWHTMVSDIMEEALEQHLLIGREAELERTIQVLGRKENCHVLHIGEPGVGKTALIYGLAQNILMRSVPEDLQGTHIYGLDLSTLVAGAQMRGEFEKRLKLILEGAQREGKCIIYIEDIHTLAGAGQTGEGSMDALAMLKPYLINGTIKFIGSTTYQEYNRHLSKHRGIVRRFQQIDVLEPSTQETLAILLGLVDSYESFHHVRYNTDALQHIVEKSALLLPERFLPEKAIDLMDEAGSLRKRKPLVNKQGKVKAERFQTVDISLVNEVLGKVCKINAKALTEDTNMALKDLDQRMKGQIFGQDRAIQMLVESVQMAKAGLLDPEKPLASLLFVGPTGVGKTEVCRVLAQELGVELVRFDMSEYTEKHTVAKLIGSPAGYVGYDDGGLLTDAIRKSPNCVLLLDEMEKAHSDIYNILLQVMDYARLTDNKGNKADFRNVFLIMTSNAGAQYASMGTLGFDNSSTRGEAMLQTVKKTFKPEFLNRLSGTIVFNDMSRDMAKLILQKKLKQLSERLQRKNVEMKMSEDALNFLLEKGFTTQYGAREMDRTIQQHLTPVLMREILFGTLRKGGVAHIIMQNNGICIRR